MTTVSSDRLPVDEQAKIERGVLELVLALHPDHLTSAEVVLMMAVDPDSAESDTIFNAISGLKGTGLIRYVGDTIEPTHAALRANKLLLG